MPFSEGWRGSFRIHYVVPPSMSAFPLGCLYVMDAAYALCDMLLNYAATSEPNLSSQHISPLATSCSAHARFTTRFPPHLFGWSTYQSEPARYPRGNQCQLLALKRKETSVRAERRLVEGANLAGARGCNEGSQEPTA